VEIEEFAPETREETRLQFIVPPTYQLSIDDLVFLSLLHDGKRASSSKSRSPKRLHARQPLQQNIDVSPRRREQPTSQRHRVG
jgi:hypothetical protein